MVGEVREVLQVHDRSGDLLDRTLAPEPGEAILDVRRVAGLADLAVVDNVDSGADSRTRSLKRHADCRL
jgi:hypothetical protein